MSSAKSVTMDEAGSASHREGIDIWRLPQFPYLILQLIQLVGDRVSLDGDHGDRARDDILAIGVDPVGLQMEVSKVNGPPKS